MDVFVLNIHSVVSLFSPLTSGICIILVHLLIKFKLHFLPESVAVVSLGEFPLYITCFSAQAGSRKVQCFCIQGLSRKLRQRLKQNPELLTRSFTQKARMHLIHASVSIILHTTDPACIFVKHMSKHVQT